MSVSECFRLGASAPAHFGHADTQFTGWFAVGRQTGESRKQNSSITI